MPLFNKFFKKKPADNGTKSWQNEFGRYLACNKPNSIQKKYNLSLKLYEQKDYLGSLEKLLEFLNDSQLNNVRFTSSNDLVEFNIIHGSCKIFGSMDKDELFVHSSISKYEDLSPSLFRHLLSKNHHLQYSGFAISKNEIIIKAVSKTNESSPEKIFFMLKEIALCADAELENLKEEFPFLDYNDITDHIQISKKEKEVKIQHIKSWITEVLSKVNKLDAEKDAMIISYYFLVLIFRIDFLIVAEGELKRKLHKCLNIYNQKQLPQHNKLTLIKQHFEEILGFNHKALEESVIKKIYTFSIIEATSHKMVYEFILEHIDKYNKIIPAIKDKGYVIWLYEYIIGYCMYYFGVYPATRSLALLIYRLIVPEFFAGLGFKPELFHPDTGKLNKLEIEKQIVDIIKEERSEYPHLGIISSNIDYNSLASFIKTLLIEITYLNFSQP